MPRGEGVAPGFPAFVPGSSEIAGHRLLRLRGAGGQGAVYEAEEPGTERLVALKTLLPDASSDEVRRFEREIEVLAELDHPGIPPLFKDGVLAGRPWFTMRLVDGPTLVEFAESSELGITDCVRLLQRVCEAVAHAHGRGVIHRDLKPDNIRVDAMGAPQVLDFGLAKASAAPTLTNIAAPMGTISHAAPEMLAGDLRKVDVRADIYSLGVILYRLIASRPPLELPESFTGALDVVRHQEPAPPSAWRPGIDADLDAISLKCLAKDPAERYATVVDLQRDLLAWLAGEPVEARGRAPGYRLRKALWRWRMPVAGVMFAVLVLSALVVRLALQAGELRHERDRARVEERKALAMAEAFTDMVEDVDPDRAAQLAEGESEAPGAADSAQALVDRVGRRAMRDLDAEPRVRASVLTAVGHAYLAIGIPTRAAGCYGDARRIIEALPDASLEERASMELAHAIADGWSPGSRTLAESALRDLVDRLDADPALRELHARALHELASLLGRSGRTTEALALVHRVLPLRREIGEDEDTALSLLLEGALLNDLEAHEEAMDSLAEARRLAEPELWLGHPRLARIDHQAARALAALGRIDEAVERSESSFARLERSHGAAHPLAVSAARDGARILSQAGRHEEAMQRLRDILELQRIMLGAHDWDTRDTLLALAGELERVGRGDEAECLRAEARILTKRLDLALP